MADRASLTHNSLTQQRAPEEDLAPNATLGLLLGDQQIRLVVLVHFQHLPL